MLHSIITHSTAVAVAAQGPRLHALEVALMNSLAAALQTPQQKPRITVGMHTSQDA